MFEFRNFIVQQSKVISPVDENPLFSLENEIENCFSYCMKIIITAPTGSEYNVKTPNNAPHLTQ